MTKEILEKYISYRGMILYKGAPELTSAFMPMMSMDAAYQIFSKEFLRNLSSYKHERKAALKRLEKAFYNFFSQFNRCFSEEDLDIIGDDQDKFHEFIQNDLLRLRIAYMEEYSVLPLDKQIEISNMFIINRLATVAGVFWEDTFHSRSIDKGDRNPDIDAVIGATKKFAMNYLPYDFVPELSKIEDTNTTTTVLCRRIANFVKEYQRIDDN